MHHVDDTSLPPPSRCWLDALPLDLIDREVARRHPSIPFYLAFAYRRFALYCRERYRLPRDPLSWFARLPLDASRSLMRCTSEPWCAVNYAVYLPDDHPRLKRNVQIRADDLIEDDPSITIREHYHEESIRDTLEVAPRYDGATCVLHSWWDDDLDSHLVCDDDGQAPPPPVDLVAVQQNQYDVLTMLLYGCGNAKPGLVVWYRYGACHRNGDRPSLVDRQGMQLWHNNGALHRDNDLPALVRVCRQDTYYIIETRWYRNGMFDRDNDLPACIEYAPPYTTWLLQWYKNGKLHRDADQPADVRVSHGCFMVSFYRDGALHRAGELPARLSDTGVAWYRDGARVAQIFGTSAWRAYADEVNYWCDRARITYTREVAISRFLGIVTT